MIPKIITRNITLFIDFILIVWSANNVLLTALRYDLYYFKLFLLFSIVGLLNIATISRKDIPRMIKESESLPYILGIILAIYALFPNLRDWSFGFYIFINIVVLVFSAAILFYKINSKKNCLKYYKLF